MGRNDLGYHWNGYILQEKRLDVKEIDSYTFLKKETVSRSKLTVSTNYGGIWVNSCQPIKN